MARQKDAFFKDGMQSKFDKTPTGCNFDQMKLQVGKVEIIPYMVSAE